MSVHSLQVHRTTFKHVRTNSESPPSPDYHQKQVVFWNALYAFSHVALLGIATFVGYYLVHQGHPTGIIGMITVIYGTVQYKDFFLDHFKHRAKEHERHRKIALFYNETNSDMTVKQRLCKAHESYWQEREQDHAKAAQKYHQEIEDQKDNLDNYDSCINLFLAFTREQMKTARAKLEQANCRIECLEQGPFKDISERCTIYDLPSERLLIHQSMQQKIENLQSLPYVMFREGDFMPLHEVLTTSIDKLSHHFPSQLLQHQAPCVSNLNGPSDTNGSF